MKAIKGLSAILVLTGILSSLYALGTNWLTITEEQMFTDTTPAPPISFFGIGLSVDVSQDNQTLITLFPGTPANDHLKVYSKDPATDQWIVSATINPSSSFNADRSECVISGNGNTIALADADFSGDVYIFQRQFDNSWLETQIINKPPGIDKFPTSVDLSFDGRTLAVGGQNDVFFPSSVFVYRKTPGPSLFSNSPDKINSHIPHPTGTDFGNAVALSDDGNTLAIGTPGILTGPLAGIVSVYKFESPTGWTLKTDLQASDGVSSDRFGQSLDFSPGAGRFLLVGAPATFPFHLTVGAGKAYLFNVLDPSFPEVASFSPSDDQQGQGFGVSVSFASDAKTVVVGSPYYDSSSGNNNMDGAVYDFEEVAGTWQEAGKIFGNPFLSASLPDTHFGFSVAAAGSEIHVGAPKLDLTSTELNRGGLYTHDTGSLSSNIGSVSIVTGGSPIFSYCYDPALLAGKQYVVLGAAGTAPGINIEDFNIPLNLDSYFLTTLMAPPASGTLDGSGQLNFNVPVPTGLSPSLAGLRFYHVVIVFDITGAGLQHVSNASPFQLTP